MITVKDILTLERTQFAVDICSKKRALEQVCEIATTSYPDIVKKKVLPMLIERERLGSTAIGNGVALPHARVKNLKQPIGILITLKSPIDFDTPDNQPVDILFALFVPEDATEEHLEILATLSELFHTESLCEKLRNAGNDKNLYQLAIQ